MIDWSIATLRSYPELAIFLSLAIGFRSSAYSSSVSLLSPLISAPLAMPVVA